ncbi:Transcription factor [Penicillium verhagenii]|uniref:Transcription factor n=1 Tax=Penicillium verhagenii TaxID=1562060 RepID=UPI002545819E|nr:Transcription factor [Penicillium verhagenii]KAJ5939168.1 Transcription factor [Penicillium verhagenii]
MSADRTASKRRCVSTACIACRRRKSKVRIRCKHGRKEASLIGGFSAMETCLAVLHVPRSTIHPVRTPFLNYLPWQTNSKSGVYDPNSDHRRKGVYKKDADTLRSRHTTLQTLFQALLNYEEDDAFDLVREIRSCDDLEEVAQSVVTRQTTGLLSVPEARDSVSDENPSEVDQFESELSGKMSELLLDGSRKFIGGTSNLIFLPSDSELQESALITENVLGTANDANVIGRWTQVTEDDSLITHLLNMYFTWHYPFFTLLAKDIFCRDLNRGMPSQYCSALLVNAMLALGCHFSSWPGAFTDPSDITTAGNHFFKEAKRLIHENDEHENAKLCTVQAFALMSVREAGCGREGKGWVYSGLSFRMAFDLGLNVDASNMGARNLTDEEVDARRITFWGCYLVDKCWSNYLGRQPQLSSSNTNVPKFDVLPREETETWLPYTDSGVNEEHAQPSRIRAIALEISKLCEISNDLLRYFYHPSDLEKSQSKQSELKKLSDVHTRLETWKKELPREFEPKEGQLPQVLVMHMFEQLLLIHLYRPFLKYTKATTPLPSHVSPRKFCTQAASIISKLLRMYKRTYGLKQICNIVVYIAHTACTIHLLNLPGRNPERDIVHGLRNLEEMADGWLAARRTLRILDISANKWHVQLPAEAIAIFERTHAKWGSWGSWDQTTSPSTSADSPIINNALHTPYTYPGGPQSPVNPALSPLRKESYGPAPVNMMGVSMGPHYPNSAIPSSAPPADQTRHMSGLPTQQAEYANPEPTYTHSIPQVNYHVSPLPSDPSAAPSPVAPSVWYNHTASQIGRTQGALSPHSTSSVDHLVEESHDWWNRNAAAALGLGTPGVENWGAGWNSTMPEQPPPISYGNNSHLMPMSAHPHLNSAVADHEVAGSLSNMPSSGDNRASGYDNHWT